MPEEHATYDQDLVRDLADYFGLTTSVAMPRGVARMSARTLSERRGLPRGLVVRAGAILATAAVIVAGFALVRNTFNGGAGKGLSSAGSGSAYAPDAPPAFGAIDGAAVSYPGMDAAPLKSISHTRLLSPAGHGTPSVSAAAARVTAAATEGSDAQAAGPAVLAWVEDSAAAPPLTCLCWVVDVPIRASARATAYLPSVLVFVDAITGRIDGAVSVVGSP
jgi:hypothetical protein